MHAAPRLASRTACRPSAVIPAGVRGSPPVRLVVRTVSEYGTDMSASLRERPDRSQSAFDADQLEALTAYVELVNTGRSAAADDLTLPDVQSVGRRYAFHGRPAGPADVPRLRAHRARLDAVAVACEAGDHLGAIEMLNTLLAETGAIPQIVAHDGRGPHIHVSRPAAPMADRIAAHLAMGLAELVVAGQADRLRSCASPACRNVFVDLSRNRSRRYCDSRTCGNRLHVAAYRARRAAAS
jgi:predicted RNA-binding Zn ribbon-like protein